MWFSIGSWQTIVDCREHLLPDRNSVQSIWYNRSVGYVCLCCHWSFRQPQKEHTKNWSEAKCEKQWKVSTAATVCAFHALLLSLPFCSGPLVKQSAFSLCRGSSMLSYMLMYLLDDCIEARLCRLKTPLCRPSEGKYLCKVTQPQYHKTRRFCFLNNQTNALRKTNESTENIDCETETWCWRSAIRFHVEKGLHRNLKKLEKDRQKLQYH